MGKTQKGFTIVELLIVIVVIAILAAITIVSYNGIQNRSYDSTVRSDLATSAKHIELYNVDNGKYPQSFNQLAATRTAGYRIVVSQGAYNTSSNNYAFCYEANAEAFAIIARGKSGKVWYVSNTQREPTEYTYGWPGGVASTCDDIIPNPPASVGQWLFQNSTWNTTIL